MRPAGRVQPDVTDIALGFVVIAAAVAVAVAVMLLLSILDNPYRPGVSELRPVAMQQTLELIDQARDALGQNDPLPCNTQGQPQ